MPLLKDKIIYQNKNNNNQNKMKRKGKSFLETKQK
jgi:hypothetical protein